MLGRYDKSLSASGRKRRREGPKFWHPAGPPNCLGSLFCSRSLSLVRFPLGAVYAGGRNLRVLLSAYALEPSRVVCRAFLAHTEVKPKLGYGDGFSEKRSKRSDNALSEESSGRFILRPLRARSCFRPRRPTEQAQRHLSNCAKHDIFVFRRYI